MDNNTPYNLPNQKPADAPSDKHHNTSAPHTPAPKPTKKSHLLGRVLEALFIIFILTLTPAIGLLLVKSLSHMSFEDPFWFVIKCLIIFLSWLAGATFVLGFQSPYKNELQKHPPLYIPFWRITTWVFFAIGLPAITAIIIIFDFLVTRESVSQILFQTLQDNLAALPIPHIPDWVLFLYLGFALLLIWIYVGQRILGTGSAKPSTAAHMIPPIKTSMKRISQAFWYLFALVTIHLFPPFFLIVVSCAFVKTCSPL